MPEFKKTLISDIVKDLHVRKARVAKAARKNKAQEEMPEEGSELVSMLEKLYDEVSEGDCEAACDTLKELAHCLQVADEVSFDTEVSSGPDMDITEEIDKEESPEEGEEEVHVDEESMEE